MLDKSRFLCLSSFQPGSENHHEGALRFGHGHPSVSNVANSSLVPEVSQDVDSSSFDSASRFSLPPIRPGSSTQTEQSLPNGLSFIRKSFQDRGIPENIIDIMCASWRPSSAKQYAVYFKKWIHFCSEREVDPYSYNVIRVLEFLTAFFDQGQSYSAINTARSALSAVFYKEQTLGNSPIIKRFMKGIFELRPPLPRYSFIWDVNIVLDYLKNFKSQDIPLSLLTYKLATLLALTTAQRAQTLHLLNIKNINFLKDKVIIPIPALLKQSNCKRYKFSLRLLPNSDDGDICVINTLKEYLKRTSVIRGSENKLFISFNRPYKSVSRSTISRWIKAVLREAGIDISIFKAHSTRAAACSNAKLIGVPIDHILKTAGWANVTSFSKFYDRIVDN